MARWRRRRPRVELPAWVLDPATDDGEAWAWAEAEYLGTDMWLEVFALMISIPRYEGYASDG